MNPTHGKTVITDVIVCDESTKEFMRFDLRSGRTTEIDRDHWLIDENSPLGIELNNCRIGLIISEGIVVAINGSTPLSPELAVKEFEEYQRKVFEKEQEAIREGRERAKNQLRLMQQELLRREQEETKERQLHEEERQRQAEVARVQKEARERAALQEHNDRLQVIKQFEHHGLRTCGDFAKHGDLLWADGQYSFAMKSYATAISMESQFSRCVNVRIRCAVFSVLKGDVEQATIHLNETKFWQRNDTEMQLHQKASNWRNALDHARAQVGRHRNKPMITWEPGTESERDYHAWLKFDWSNRINALQEPDHPILKAILADILRSGA